MKFEAPKINIEMFVSEDVITTSGEVTANTVAAATAALGGHLSGGSSSSNTFTFLFD